MQLIFDHIGSVLIGVTVVLVLLATQMRVQQNSIESVVAHSAKTKALSLGQWLEEDITSLGANFGRNLMRFEHPQYDAHANTTRWVFYSDTIHASGDVTRHLTRYTLEEIGLDDSVDPAEPLYELTRETAHATLIGETLPPIPEETWAENGRSINTLTRFRIELVDRDGAQTSNVERADFIRVEFSLRPEMLRRESYVNELHWNTLLKVRPFWQSTPSTP